MLSGYKSWESECGWWTEWLTGRPWWGCQRGVPRRSLGAGAGQWDVSRAFHNTCLAFACAFWENVYLFLCFVLICLSLNSFELIEFFIYFEYWSLFKTFMENKMWRCWLGKNCAWISIFWHQDNVFFLNLIFHKFFGTPSYDQQIFSVTLWAAFLFGYIFLSQQTFLYLLISGF